MRTANAPNENRGGRTMRRTNGILASAILPGFAAPAGAVDDGHGHEWRQLYETTGLSWNDVAAVCPRDGSTPCEGSSGCGPF